MRRFGKGISSSMHDRHSYWLAVALWLLVLLFFVSLAAISMPGQAYALEWGEMGVECPDLPWGDEVSFAVKVKGSPQLASMGFTVDFDNTMLAYLGYSVEGTLLANRGKLVKCGLEGTGDVGCSANPNPPVEYNSEGTLYVLRFMTLDDAADSAIVPFNLSGDLATMTPVGCVPSLPGGDDDDDGLVDDDDDDVASDDDSDDDVPADDDDDVATSDDDFFPDAPEDDDADDDADPRDGGEGAPAGQEVDVPDAEEIQPCGCGN